MTTKNLKSNCFTADIFNIRNFTIFRCFFFFFTIYDVAMAIHVTMVTYTVAMYFCTIVATSFKNSNTILKRMKSRCFST